MATLTPDASGRVTISVNRGDSDDLLFTVMDDAASPAAVDLSKATDGTASRRAILKFVVKTVPVNQASPEELFLRTSYADSEIMFATQSGATLGQATVMLDKPDIETADVDVSYAWGLDVIRQDALRAGASAGTVSYVNGSATVLGSGTAFGNAKAGDVLQPLGVFNGRPVIILEVVSDTELLMDFDTWTTEPGVAFEIRRGKHRLAVRGPFDVQPGLIE
jgi:hypothetical protein